MEWLIKARERFEANKRYQDSEQKKLIEWLLDNPNKQFTVASIARDLDIRPSSVSATIRNTKRWFGYDYTVVKMSERCLNYRKYRFTGFVDRAEKKRTETKMINSVFN